MSHSITVLKSKLHNATVTHALKDYEGSVALSPELIKLGNFSMHEQVHLWNITQGTRLITYIMEYDGDERGIICVNGAAAHRANPGDRIILATFAEIDSEEAENWEPHIVIMNEDNTQKVTQAFEMLLEKCNSTILVATHSKNVAMKLKGKLVIESGKTTESYPG